LNQSSTIQCRRFVVHGKVQGVFFRASARDVARNLGITGHAINLPNGCVEVLACGRSDALQALRNWLHQGPAMAKVDTVDEECVDLAAPNSFKTG
jgi:acylphosphatase